MEEKKKQMKTDIKADLDKLVQKYETKEFIENDPIQFPHRFEDERDIELAGFISSLFAYGNRKIFIKKLDELFQIMQNEPLNFVQNFDEKSLKSFSYRFSKDFEIVELFKILKKLYKTSNLKELFEYGYSKKDIFVMEQIVVDFFYSNVKNSVGQGFYHLLPSPEKGGAMKRMNMLLRWFVRDGIVDLGIWKFIKKSELLIPLDTHVARLSREMGILKRSSNDKKAVIELSEKLKEFDPQDPIKYDFAIFGLGVDKK